MSPKFFSILKNILILSSGTVVEIIIFVTLYEGHVTDAKIWPTLWLSLEQR